jgi:hypothetical protein
MSVENENTNDPGHIAKMTEGYVIVPPDMYPLLASGDHIRYIDIDGNFRKGGYIWYSRKIYNSEISNAWMIGVFKTLNTGFQFILDWKKIQTLWKKTPIEAGMLKNAIDDRHKYLIDITLFLMKKFGTEFSDFLNERERNRANT